MRSPSAASGRQPGTAPAHGTAAQRGSVTAEFAAVVPAVVLVLACCLAALQLAGQQLTLHEAATMAVRSIARGESAGDAAAVATRAVAGAMLATSHPDPLVCVRITARSSSPLGTLLGVTLSASSCALAGGL